VCGPFVILSDAQRLGMKWVTITVVDSRSTARFWFFGFTSWLHLLQVANLLRCSEGGFWGFHWLQASSQISGS
jgi:hypothetical protein